MALVVLFGMFAASAATVELYNKCSRTPAFSDKISIKDTAAYPIYDAFAETCALSPDDVEITYNSDEHNSSLMFQSTCYGQTAVLIFGIEDVEDLDEFCALIHKYEETK